MIRKKIMFVMTSPYLVNKHIDPGNLQIWVIKLYLYI